jgi:hypothetical protein
MTQKGQGCGQRQGQRQGQGQENEGGKREVGGAEGREHCYWYLYTTTATATATAAVTHKDIDAISNIAPPATQPVQQSQLRRHFELTAELLYLFIESITCFTLGATLDSL